MELAGEAKVLADRVLKRRVVIHVKQAGQGRKDVGVHLVQGLRDAVLGVEGVHGRRGLGQRDQNQRHLVDHKRLEQVSHAGSLVAEDGVGQDIKCCQDQLRRRGLEVALGSQCQEQTEGGYRSGREFYLVSVVQIAK